MVRQGHRLLTGPGGIARLCEVKNAYSWRRGLPPYRVHVSRLGPRLLHPGHVPDAVGVLPDGLEDVIREFVVTPSVTDYRLKVVGLGVQDARMQLSVLIKH